MIDLKKYFRVYAEIDLDSICHNLIQMQRNISKDTGIIAVIKADGYGHGAVPIAKTIDSYVSGFAVATIEEAINLREHSIQKPIYILGFTHDDAFEDMILNDIRPAIFQYQTAQSISTIAQKLGRKAKVHIKLDTGMSRIGFNDTDESLAQIEKISNLPGLDIEGIFTHFAASDSADKKSAMLQLARFLSFITKLENHNIMIPIKHCSNSAGIIEMPQANMDRVRAGISIYGLYPSEEVSKDIITLKPALALKSHIIFIKELEAGVGISYGSTYVTDKRTRVATIPVGYADGYPRNLSNKGYILIRGNKAPILGRVCMDQFMVDITDIPEAEEGDEVTLIGKDGDLQITVEELSELAGTFNYEFVCNLSKRIPRVYWKNNQVIGTKDYFHDNYGEIGR